MPRLFTGLEIPADIGSKLALKCGGLAGARWIDPESYHVTLRFIGDVERPVANEIADQLEIFSNRSPFEVSLTGFGVFGGAKPRALFVNVAKNPTLTALRSAQERLFQQIGLSPDRQKFTPHVTLARLKGVDSQSVAQFINQTGWSEALQFPVSRFVLYSARASIGGGPYAIEEIYEFKG